MTPFSTLLSRTTSTERGLSLDVPPDWAQGRTVFGGLQVSLAVKAMRADVPDVPLRTLQVTFIGPLTPGTVRVETTILRTGSSATHVEARVFGSELASIVVGVFGKPRTSAVAVTLTRPTLTPDKAFKLPYIPGLAPAFLQHFEGTWLRGSILLSGGRDTSHTLEVGVLEAGPATESHVIALADYIPPLAMTFLRKPTNGGTLSWMLELLTDQFGETVRGWQVDAELMAARDGYTSQSLVLWSPDGRPIALGRQSMVVFA